MNDTALLRAARARQLERQRKDTDAAIQHRKKSWDANKHYFDLAANLQAEGLEIGDLALVHETKIVQSHGVNLDARLQGPYWVTEVAQSLETYQLPAQDRAELTSWINGSRLQNDFTRNKGVHSSRDICSPNTTQDDKSDEFKEFKADAVAGWKYIEGRWIY